MRTNRNKQTETMNKTTETPTLTYDGHGLNLPDEHRTRLCTFTPKARENGQADQWGPRLVTALADLEQARKTIEILEDDMQVLFGHIESARPHGQERDNAEATLAATGLRTDRDH